MIPKVFLNTNVVVDYAIKNRPYHNEAVQVLETCTENSVVLTTSPASICTLIYLLEKDKWPHETEHEQDFLTQGNEYRRGSRFGGPIWPLKNKLYSNEMVKKWLLSFVQLVEMVNTSNTDIFNAASSAIPDTEDALLMFTAISNSCDVFVTRNLRDFPLERKDILVLSPEDLMKKF